MLTVILSAHGEPCARFWRIAVEVEGPFVFAGEEQTKGSSTRTPPRQKQARSRGVLAQNDKGVRGMGRSTGVFSERVSRKISVSA